MHGPQLTVPLHFRVPPPQDEGFLESRLCLTTYHALRSGNVLEKNGVSQAFERIPVKVVVVKTWQERNNKTDGSCKAGVAKRSRKQQHKQQHKGKAVRRTRPFLFNYERPQEAREDDISQGNACSGTTLAAFLESGSSAVHLSRLVNQVRATAKFPNRHVLWRCIKGREITKPESN